MNDKNEATNNRPAMKRDTINHIKRGTYWIMLLGGCFLNITLTWD
jgi:hypothetical protein